jgi:hypothetical protein
MCCLPGCAPGSAGPDRNIIVLNRTTASYRPFLVPFPFEGPSCDTTAASTSIRDELFRVDADGWLHICFATGWHEPVTQQSTT